MRRTGRRCDVGRVLDINIPPALRRSWKSSKAPMPQGLMESARHAITRISNPRVLSCMASYDVASTIHESLRRRACSTAPSRRGPRGTPSTSSRSRNSNLKPKLETLKAVHQCAETRSFQHGLQLVSTCTAPPWSSPAGTSSSIPPGGKVVQNKHSKRCRCVSSG